MSVRRDLDEMDRARKANVQRDSDASVRDAALEEAAQAIEAEAGEWAGSGLAIYHNSALRRAARIVRDLKGNRND